jgi:hypothetical protein
MSKEPRFSKLQATKEELLKEVEELEKELEQYKRDNVLTIDSVKKNFTIDLARETIYKHRDLSATGVCATCLRYIDLEMVQYTNDSDKVTQHHWYENRHKERILICDECIVKIISRGIDVVTKLLKEINQG